MDDLTLLRWIVICMAFIAIVSELYRLEQKANNLRCEICRWRLKQEITKRRDELAKDLVIEQVKQDRVTSR